ncbi:hypothetical protein SB766_16560 [Pseudomonas sp. SIMBA_077]
MRFDTVQSDDAGGNVHGGVQFVEPKALPHIVAFFLFFGFGQALGQVADKSEAVTGFDNKQARAVHRGQLLPTGLGPSLDSACSVLCRREGLLGPASIVLMVSVESVLATLSLVHIPAAARSSQALCNLGLSIGFRLASFHKLTLLQV